MKKKIKLNLTKNMNQLFFVFVFQDWNIMHNSTDDHDNWDHKVRDGQRLVLWQICPFFKDNFFRRK